jgi:hypothetical protein
MQSIDIEFLLIDTCVFGILEMLPDEKNVFLVEPEDVH